MSMLSTLVSILLLILSALSLSAQTLTPAFIENNGQWPDDVRYRLQLDGMTMWVTDRGAVYDLHEVVAPTFALPRVDRFDRNDAGLLSQNDQPMHVRGHVLRAEFVDASPQVEAIGGEAMGGRFNYLIGNDRSRWGRNCRAFASVRLSDVYDGIDVVYYLDKGMPRYDLIIAPGADIARVRMMVDGADDVRAVAGGRLAIGTSLGDMEMRELITYQLNEKGERCQVSSRFLVDGGAISYAVGAYDRSRPLVVDPLMYSTIIGGWFDDQPSASTIDVEGNVFVTGPIDDPVPERGYPWTSGAYDTTQNGSTDIVVTKLNAKGSALIFSTFIGSAGSDIVHDIAVDGSGDVYLTGWTQPPSPMPAEFAGYPTTDGVFGDTVVGQGDIFVTKLTADGSALIYSTIFGGSDIDEATSIAVDQSGNAYIAGFSSGRILEGGRSYPTTDGAYDTTSEGERDVIVTKLNANGSNLVYSTFIGGIDNDHASDIALGADGSVFVTGETKSDTTYPTTEGAFTRHMGRNRDVFVTKLSPDGTSLVYSASFGGAKDDEGEAIAVDASGAAYVTGTTTKPSSHIGGYPLTPGAFGSMYMSSRDLFVTKLNPTGASLDYSTLIGGSGSEYVHDLALDRDGFAIVAGSVNEGNVPFPTTENAYSLHPVGGGDAIIAKVSADGSSLTYATFLGGTSYDVAISIDVDLAGYLYIVGLTVVDIGQVTGLFPTTDSAFSQRHFAGSNIFVAKLSQAISAAGYDWSRKHFPLDLR